MDLAAAKNVSGTTLLVAAQLRLCDPKKEMTEPHL